MRWISGLVYTTIAVISGSYLTAIVSILRGKGNPAEIVFWSLLFLGFLWIATGLGGILKHLIRR